MLVEEPGYQYTYLFTLTSVEELKLQNVRQEFFFLTIRKGTLKKKKKRCIFFQDICQRKYFLSFYKVLIIIKDKTLKNENKRDTFPSISIILEPNRKMIR